MSANDSPDPAYVLRLFNEKAEELSGTRFLGSIRDGKGTYTIHWERGAEPIVEHDFPHREELKSFVLTFRLFVAKNESFSFRRLRTLYAGLPISDRTLHAAVERLDTISKYLDAPSKLIVNREVISRKRVLDIGLYGGLAHANNVGDKAIRDYWASNPMLDVTLQDEFIDILMTLTQFIFSIHLVNLDALSELAC